MTDTVTEQLRAKYAKDFDSRFERELQQPIRNLIHDAELFRPYINFTFTVPLGADVIDAFKAHKTFAQVKKQYIDARLSEAVNFIEKGAGNGTRT